jgi:lipopolysaccharide/colanic/teichoic acid biosynthesis glycosyltransferase
MIRTAKGRNSQLGKMFRRLKPAGAEIVLSECQFANELKKEIYRSDRRASGREFGLVRVVGLTDRRVAQALDSDYFSALLDRLRITDSIGWFENSLALLLPEADKEGTLVVANEVTRLLHESGLDLDVEVSMYPLDDELISLSKEFLISSDDSDDEDQPKQHNGLNGVAGPKSKRLVEDANVKMNRNKGSDSHAIQGVRQTVRRFVPVTRTPWWKRSVDVLGAGAGLLCLSPLLIGAAIAIKLSSKGPVFFLQEREGKDGKQFGILKFRTMIINAEDLQSDLRSHSEQDGPAFKLTDDPRVTKVGKYLRKSCIDELPQLWNVLKGDMSLVGPRPLPVQESLACTAWQRARLAVLPGLTCTWQAYGGRDVKFAQWMQMDLDYIDRQSFWFDMKLIVDTACMAVLHRGSV